jgi:phage baseplate assembly protein gpV
LGRARGLGLRLAQEQDAPVVGQAVTVICPSGMPETGIVLPGHFTDANPKPDSDDDYVRMNGDGAVSRMKGKEIEHKIGDNVSVKLDDNLITLKVGNSTITIEPNQITLISDTIATVGTTNLGHDSKSETLVPNVLVVGDVSAKKTFAKKG